MNICDFSPEERTRALYYYFGWQGGTVHQLAAATGLLRRRFVAHETVRVRYHRRETVDCRLRLAEDSSWEAYCERYGGWKRLVYCDFKAGMRDGAKNKYLFWIWPPNTLTTKF